MKYSSICPYCQKAMTIDFSPIDDNYIHYRCQGINHYYYSSCVFDEITYLSISGHVSGKKYWANFDCLLKKLKITFINPSSRYEIPYFEPDIQDKQTYLEIISKINDILPFI